MGEVEEYQKHTHTIPTYGIFIRLDTRCTRTCPQMAAEKERKNEKKIVGSRKLHVQHMLSKSINYINVSSPF